MEQKWNLLIIESDTHLRESFVNILRTRGQVTVAGTATDAANAICKSRFDFIVINQSLSDGSGLDLINSIRESSRQEIPILLVADSITKENALRALELRVIYILEAPYSLDLLRSYLDKYLKSDETVLLSKEQMVLHPDLRSVSINGKVVELTSIEFKILSLFTENKNRQIPRSTLENYVWGNAGDNSSKNVLDTHLYNLKKKVPLLKEKIRTIHGSGLVYQP